MIFDEFLIVLDKQVPDFVDWLMCDDEYNFIDDEVERLYFMLGILHDESFCGYKIMHEDDGEEYLDALANSITRFRDRINSLYKGIG